MRLSLYTYNGTAINDGSNYEAFFVRDTLFTQPEPSIMEVPRHAAPPAYVDKQYAGRTLRISVKMLGTIHSQISALQALFDLRDRTARTLIAKDSANSDKQWYMTVVPKAQPPVKGQEFFIDLYAADGVWRSVTQNTDTWNITATGQTDEVTVGGSMSVAPIIELTPTAAKSATGFNYLRYVTITNPNALTMPAYPIEVTGGGLSTAALLSDTSVSNQINQGAGIDAVVTTIPIDTSVGGGLATAGMGYVDTEQITWTGNSAGNLTGVTRGANGTTAATHADNAVISRSKIQADGHDLRVYVDGRDANRWLSGTVGGTVKVWSVLNFAPKITATVGAMTDVATSLTLQDTTANTTSAAQLSTAGAAKIDSEIITWTGKSGKTFTGLTRGARGTTAAAHSAGATLTWLQYDIQLMYGDMSSVAQLTDDTQKPIFDLTSTNTSWVYGTNQSTLAGKRTGEWRGGLTASLSGQNYRTSRVYTANHNTFADPSTEMGLHIGSWLLGTTPRAENATIIWTWYNPAGATTILPVGETNRVSGVTWPALMGVQVSNNGVNWTTGLAISSPATGYNAWTPGSTALGATYKYVRLITSGAVGAGPSYAAGIEVATITMTLDSSTVPQVSVSAEQTSKYTFNATITNNTTGMSITIAATIALNQTIQIDCANKKVVYLADNSRLTSAISWSSVRQAWLDFNTGANTLQFDDTGTLGVTLVSKWNDVQN